MTSGAESMPYDTLLVVDDEENILRALTRLLRRDGYRILTAGSAAEGLQLLEQHPGVGVVISDQRMPGMMGSEFLGIVKKRHPNTIRIMLSGYTELKSVTDAINEGAIYKFLTKPWDDELLRADIRQAFGQHALGSEHPRFSTELSESRQTLAQQEHAPRRDSMPDIADEMLEYLPVGVIGTDGAGIIFFANRRAHQLLGSAADTLSCGGAQDVLPGELMAMLARTDTGGEYVQRGVRLNGRRMDVHLVRRSIRQRAHGCVLVLVPEHGP